MEPFYKAHWRDVDEDRMKGYRSGFQWSDAAEEMYAPAEIAPGQAIADFGCGPGHVAVELARRVGPHGHVHAFDINADFLALVRENARKAELGESISTHLSDGAAIQLQDGSLDRVSARNAIMYVDDPVATLREFHRILRKGGLAHAIEGDWFMMVMEPVEHDLWRSFVKAAAHACRHADMGRKLYGNFHEAGFSDVEVRVISNADTDGRLVGMVRNMAKYARLGGKLPDSKVDEVLQVAEDAMADGSYFAISPQFVVTGRR